LASISQDFNFFHWTEDDRQQTDKTNCLTHPAHVHVG